MDRILWHDAKIEKPDSFDPVTVLTSDGLMLIAQWDYKKGYWYDRNTDETFGNVAWWGDYKLPATWNISDDYYENDPNRA